MDFISLLGSFWIFVHPYLQSNLLEFFIEIMLIHLEVFLNKTSLYLTYCYFDLKYLYNKWTYYWTF